MWDSWWQDIRQAARLVRNNPGFSAVLIGCLALGIGPTTTAFSLINASLLHAVDVDSPETLVTILTNRVGAERPSEGISYPNYVDLRDRSTTLDVAVAADAKLSIRSEGTSELAEGAMVSPNFFDVLGRKALLGDVFHAGDNDTPGSQPVVVLGYAYWQDKFQGSPDVLGKTMRMNGHDFKVVGVMPQSFTGQMAVVQPILWASTTMLDEIRPDIPSQRVQRNHSWMDPFARIRPGASIEQANKDLADISRQLAAEFPQSNEFMSFSAAPFTGIPVSIAEGVGQLVALAGVVVLLLLLLSCSSTAALQLARATVRRREIAIRMAIGASRWRIVRQLLVESVFVAILAGGLALLLTLWAFELYKVLLPDGPRGIVLGSSLDYRVLAFTLLASVVAGILFGLAPAWQMSRPDLIAPLKSQEPGGDFGSARVRNVLVAAQFALAVVLMISAGLFVRGLRRAQTLDPGFETERMVIFDTDLTIYGYSMQRTNQFVDDFLKRIGELPGVESVSVSRFPPLSRSSSNTGMTPIGEDLTAGASVMVGLNWAAPGYFDTVGIPFVAGRDFNTKDSRLSKRVVIINESLARRFGGAKEALGKMASGGPGESVEIVGVVKDSKYWSFGEEDVDFVYLAIAQTPTRELAFCIRTNGDADAMLTPIASAIRSFNNDLALSPLRTIQEHTRQSLAPARMSAILFAVMGGLALLLAVIGVYGVVSYSVTRRQLEIGVRMALGGQPRDLIALLVRRGLRLVAIGAAAGICAAFGVTRFLAPLLNGGSPTDWQVFLFVPLVLVAVAWLAIYLPARKATRVDPMVVLRYE
ncbi:MAG: ABC transporter permease [Planctomycetia bacterium]|nr:ABC transporter permease [Planctomycetia bacterium]